MIYYICFVDLIQTFSNVDRRELVRDIKWPLKTWPKYGSEIRQQSKCFNFLFFQPKNEISDQNLVYLDS